MDSAAADAAGADAVAAGTVRTDTDDGCAARAGLPDSRRAAAGSGAACTGDRGARRTVGRDCRAVRELRARRAPHRPHRRRPTGRTTVAAASGHSECLQR